MSVVQNISLERQQSFKAVAKRPSLTQTQVVSELKFSLAISVQSTMSETEDSDVPTILPILRISSHQGTKQQRRDSQKEIKGMIVNIILIKDQSTNVPILL